MAEVFKARIGGEGEGPLPDGAVPMIAVPASVIEAIGQGKRPPVLVTINGHTWRSTPAVYGGQFYLPVRKSNGEAAKLELGDRVEVRLELDTAPRLVEPPPALAEALAADESLKAAWDRLSFTSQREHADAIASARQMETRARRLAKLLDSLRGK